MGAPHDALLIEVDPVEHVGGLDVPPAVGHDWTVPAGDTVDARRRAELALDIRAVPLARDDAVEIAFREDLARPNDLTGGIEVDHPGVLSGRLQRILQPLAA